MSLRLIIERSVHLSFSNIQGNLSFQAIGIFGQRVCSPLVRNTIDRIFNFMVAKLRNREFYWGIRRLVRSGSFYLLILFVQYGGNYVLIFSPS